MAEGKDLDWFYGRRLGKYVELLQLASDTAVELGNPADRDRVFEVAREAEEKVMDMAGDRLPGNPMERLMVFCAVGIGMLKTCSDIADAVAFGLDLAEIGEEYGWEEK